MHDLSVIELSGSPWELGHRHGQKLARGIRAMRRGLLRYLLKAGLVVGACPIMGILLLLGRRFWPAVPRPFQEEMQGVAAGAQVNLSFILLINVLDDLANNVPRCSGLAAGGDYTADGFYLAGRNLDYPLFIDELISHQTLFVVEPHRGKPFASLAWPGYIGVCTGLSKAGVAMSQLSAMSRDTSLKGMPAALRFRQGLETAASLPEAAQAILAVKGTIGNNVLLASADEACVLELSATRGVVRPPLAGLLTVTNHYQTPAMAPWRGRFPRRPPFSPLSSYYFSEDYSRSRDARLQELAQNKILRPEDVQTILADADIANPGTVASLVFNPAERTLWVARGQKPPVNRGLFQKIKPWH
ncbi:MAG: C45 family autoproteolytic acyltransferase/hydrolase [Deltaproteobacteria bacterium]|nr:C45 family autoproteolytic acyltransferase/hydrolase [Deltaproteobacteria bacterium]